MIKVKDTRMHTIVPHYSHYEVHQTEPQVLVAEAKLVLAGGIKPQYYDTCLPSERAQYLKPILISETEKIVVGDWFYNIKSGFIAELHESQNTVEGDCKVLALPEHFSPKHLSAIVDGKMKDGCAVLVECERYSQSYGVAIDEASKDSHRHITIIKLNSSNYITLHKKEEKMYTLNQMCEAFNAGMGWGINQSFNQPFNQWIKNVK